MRIRRVQRVLATDGKIKYHTGTNHVDYMRFCTSCGKEGTPGKKFCEYCGAPFEQPDTVPGMSTPTPAVPAPVIPQTVAVKSAGGSGKTLAIGGIIVVLVLIAGIYFIGMPLIGGSSGTGSTIRQSTPLPTTVQTLPQTLATVITTDVPRTSDIPAATEIYEEKYTETYNQVYAVNHAFAGGQKEIFTYNLASPPLYIKFDITPKIFFEDRLVEIGLHSEHIANVSYISPDAWFKVRVYDADNGILLEEQGFNKEHGVITKQEFMVRKPGYYRVELSGNDVIAGVSILAGK
jgi:hypothetical protein